MPLAIDFFTSIIQVTSPTTTVDAQTLADFIEDEMATPVGSLHADIIQPEGKIEDPSNPGVFSQIIIILNSPWQVQFFGGSGYTRIFGGKLVGGLGDEPMKATGTAGDITVLESPVDGVTVAVGSGLSAGQAVELTETHQLLRNRREINIITGIETIYADDSITPLFTRPVWVDVAGIIQYDGTLVPHRVDRYA